VDLSQVAATGLLMTPADDGAAPCSWPTLPQRSRRVDL